MAAISLTRGAIAAIIKGGAAAEGLSPVLRVVEVRPLSNSQTSSERYRLMLSDGVDQHQAMIASQTAGVVRSGALRDGSIIQPLPWHFWPPTRAAAAALVVPLSVMCTPLTPIADAPLLCSRCHGALNPYARADYRSLLWSCPFCDVAGCEEELLAVKGEILHVMAQLPENAMVGLVSFGGMVWVHDLGFGECSRVVVFCGDRELTSNKVFSYITFEPGSGDDLMNSEGGASTSPDSSLFFGEPGPETGQGSSAPTLCVLEFDVITETDDDDMTERPSAEDDEVGVCSTSAAANSSDEPEPEPELKDSAPIPIHTSDAGDVETKKRKAAEDDERGVCSPPASAMLPDELGIELGDVGCSSIPFYSRVFDVLDDASDSDDDVPLYLLHAWKAVKVPLVGHKEDDDEDGEEDLVIVTDEQQSIHWLEEQDWGEEAAVPAADGERKDVADAGKVNGAVAGVAGARIGYGGHGFNPQHHSMYKFDCENYTMESLRWQLNSEGTMEYWLERANLAEIRERAGVKDPYWVPLPEWQIGDGVTVCTLEMEACQLWEDVAALKALRRQVGKLNSISQLEN